MLDSKLQELDDLLRNVHGEVVTRASYHEDVILEEVGHLLLRGRRLVANIRSEVNWLKERLQ